MVSWWNALWSSTIPPKVKIFWWRILHNIIPTSWNSRNNYIHVTLSCGLCECGLETTLHSLFLCPSIRPLWKNSLWFPCIAAPKGGFIMDLALWARNFWKKEAFETFAMCVWEVWNIRNKWIHRGSRKVCGNELLG
ncbi:hypothetical protein UlMin_021673 [Ulmus minor]